jgi:hypothetical protein
MVSDHRPSECCKLEDGSAAMTTSGFGNAIEVAGTIENHAAHGLMAIVQATKLSRMVGHRLDGDRRVILLNFAGLAATIHVHEDCGDFTGLDRQPSLGLDTNCIG